MEKGADPPGIGRGRGSKPGKVFKELEEPDGNNGGKFVEDEDDPE